MSLQFEKFNINAFWDSTPSKLKYILILVLFFVGMYFIISRNMINKNIDQIDKIEESINTTYILLDTFDEFRKSQTTYNNQMLKYIANLYVLVEELNDNTNQKFKLLLQYNGNNADNILQNILILNESFLKIQKAYTPEEIIINPYNKINMNGSHDTHYTEEYKKELLQQYKMHQQKK